MKRYAKYIIGLAVIAVVAVLVMVNRNSVQEDIDRASAKQLSVVLDGVEQIYEYSEEDPAYVEFDAQMRKKNGDVYDNHYAGMPLSTILESMGAAIQEDSAVTVTCADQYEIQLTGAEILAEGNVYLVTKENGEPLPGVYVAGDITTTGKMMEPAGDLTYEMAYETYCEQIKVLEENWQKIPVCRSISFR